MNVTPKRSASAKGLEFDSKTLKASLRVADSLVTWIRLSVSRSQTCKGAAVERCQPDNGLDRLLHAFRIQDRQGVSPVGFEKSRINSFMGFYRTVLRGRASQDVAETEKADRSPIAV